MDDLYGVNSPISSIARGDDYGRLSSLRTLNIATTPSTLEKLILADCRCHQITVKVVANGNEGRERLHGNTIVFTQEPEGFAKATFGEAAVKAAVKGISFVFVGPKGSAGKLERSALQIPDLAVSPTLLWNFLQLRHKLRGNAAPPLLHDVKRWVEANSVEAHLKETASWVDDPAGIRFEAATTASDVANVRFAASCSGASSRDDDAGDEGRDNVELAPVMETVGIVEAPTQGMGTVIRGVADAVETRTRAEGDENEEETNNEDGAGATNNADKHDHHNETDPVKIRRSNEPTNDYSSAAEALYAAWWPLFLLSRGLVKGKPVPKKKIRHMFLYFDNRFAHDLPLVFHLANTMLRHAVNISVSARVKSSPIAFAEFTKTVNDPNFKEMLQEAKRDPEGDIARQVTSFPLACTRCAYDHRHARTEHTHASRHTHA